MFKYLIILFLIFFFFYDKRLINFEINKKFINFDSSNDTNLKNFFKINSYLKKNNEYEFNKSLHYLELIFNIRNYINKKYDLYYYYYDILENYLYLCEFHFKNVVFNLINVKKINEKILELSNLLKLLKLEIIDNLENDKINNIYYKQIKNDDINAFNKFDYYI